MQATTLIKIAAAGALAAMCTAAYLQDQATAGTDPQPLALAAVQPQPAPVIDMGSMFRAARR